MTSSRVEKPTEPNALILEAWGQGFMVGSLVIMAAMAIANMRPKILLHKVILVEVRSSSHICAPCSMQAARARKIFLY